MPTKIDVVLLSHRTALELAGLIRDLTRRKDFIGIDPVAPWYDGEFHHAIVILTVADDGEEDGGPPRWR
jgi:hypothetical protein